MTDDAKRKALCKRALERIARGDSGALSELYDLIGKKVYFTAYSVLGQRCDAEDAAQDTFVEVLESAGSYSGRDACAWVISIARNQALNRLRKRRGTEQLEEAEQLPAEETDVASSLTLLDALDRLAPEEKRVVTLHVLCGMKFKEIAAETSENEAAVQKRYRRAVEKMKKYYGQR